jgi:hypothetical protein
VEIVKIKYIAATIGIIIILVAAIIYSNNPDVDYIQKQTGWAGKVASAMDNQQQVDQDYLAGNISKIELISKTNSNKVTVDNVVTEMEKTTPPSKYLHIHELLLSAYKEDSNGLKIIIQGANLTVVNQARNLFQNATPKIEQATNELGNITQRSIKNYSGLKNT